MQDGAWDYSSYKSLLTAFSEAFALLASVKNGISLEFSELKQTVYSRYVRSQPSYTASLLLDWNGIGITADADPGLSFYVLERLLGGNGSPGIVNRPLSVIEQAVVSDFFSRLAEGLGTVAGWCGSEAPEWKKLYPSVSETGLTEEESPVVILSFNADGKKDNLRIVFPAAAGSALCALLSEAFAEDGSVRFSAETEGVVLSETERADLGIGDVIALGKPGNLLQFRIGKKLCCRCETGLSGDKPAVRTVDVMPEPERDGTVTVLFGRGRIGVAQATAPEKGITALVDRKKGEPAGLLVSGKAVALCEFVMLEDKLGVRIIKLI